MTHSLLPHSLLTHKYFSSLFPIPPRLSMPIAGALTSVLTSIRNELLFVLHNPEKPRAVSLTLRCERLMREKRVKEEADVVAGSVGSVGNVGSVSSVVVAGRTTEFVNKVLEKVDAGDTCGGLPINSVAPFTGMDLDDD